MNTEAEHYVKKVAEVKNEAELGQLKKKATRYLRPNEVRARKAEMENIDRLLSSGNIGGAAMTSQGRAKQMQRKNYLQRELNECAPPTDLSTDTRDAIHTRVKQLEAEIRDGMPPSEVMRRNPPGAIDWHRKWEKKNKTKILEWKNAQLLLDPTDESVDRCNVERLRPSMMGQTGNGTFMPEAQIPGQFGYHSVPDENWENTFGTVETPNSPLARADSPEIEELRRMNEELAQRLAHAEKELDASMSRLADVTHKGKGRRISPEERARQSQRMKDRWAKKKAMEAQEKAGQELS